MNKMKLQAVTGICLTHILYRINTSLFENDKFNNRFVYIQFYVYSVVVHTALSV